MTQRSTPHASLAVRLGHMSKWFTDQSYEAITLREARDSLAATPALGPCTQAELDAAAFDSKQSRLISMWMERALKAEAATPAVGGERNAAIEECAKLIESGAGMADLIDQEELDQQAKYIRALAAQPASPLRVTGAINLVEEAACLIWSELCPGLVMGDEDIPHYEAAAKAVLSLPPSPLRGTVERAIDAVGDVISGRDDMGHVHFVELATAIRAACAAPMDGETKA